MNIQKIADSINKNGYYMMPISDFLGESNYQKYIKSQLYLKYWVRNFGN